ncbi:glyoxalase superfamily protein [Saccharospirillum mangrovi]|uniref:glyoxalase superfamily protein n=1 Tax=Saccharospirillum mangrovi TaxID=2161747 RepID=UPI000D3BAA2F|nr:glyoxalase superfamily protein [Saccharospirillum mangrovi]
MSEPLPTREQIKAQAKRLRQAMAADGETISHSQALELIAAHHGFRDWNTLSAQLDADAPVLPGASVSGRYLGRTFTATVLSVEPVQLGAWHIQLQLDEAIDVVESEHFSSLRRRIRATIDHHGVTQEKISGGVPVLQLVLRAD